MRTIASKPSTKLTATYRGVVSRLAMAVLFLICATVTESTALGQQFEVTAPKKILTAGESVQLRVTITLKDGTLRDITSNSTTIYKSSPPEIARVSATGGVNALKAGIVTIGIINDDLNNPDYEGFPPESFIGSIEFFIGTPGDTDGDGLPNTYEVQNSFDPADPRDAPLDSDNDGLNNLREFQLGTDPHNKDTDGDGISDADEFKKVLDDTCIATVLNRPIQVAPEGTFTIGNVTVPTGPFRVRVICERPNKTELAQSAFVVGLANGVTELGEIVFGVTSSIPVSLAITSPVNVLTKVAPTVQLVTTGTLPDNTTTDLTLRDTGTFYVSSNPAIATVSKDGLVTAVSSGNVIITATHEGVIGTILLNVQLTQDSDGDGMPDDYEQANSINPGGANLARLPGTQVSASSFSNGFPPSRAIDGNVQTHGSPASATRRTNAAHHLSKSPCHPT